MSKKWRIRVQSQGQRKQPNIDLLVRAVLVLGEQMQAEVNDVDEPEGNRPITRTEGCS